jgi:hypothetical protein
MHGPLNVKNANSIRRYVWASRCDVITRSGSVKTFYLASTPLRFLYANYTICKADGLYLYFNCIFSPISASILYMLYIFQWS